MATETKIDVPGMTNWISLLRPNPDVNMCRIPAEQVKANDNIDQDYVPKYISIGPYHYGKEELRSMQKVKYIYLEDLLAWNQNNTKERYTEVVKEVYLSSEKISIVISVLVESLMNAFWIYWWTTVVFLWSYC
ncbi:hypothetical protein ZOSMA_563G00070 [Zostera marina]|uniref:Uncharacterized protein n=1 Tax=Zostera marina TaxID=29655 RepID=A0A0K9NYC7_ZOSMR|nr:hypothetical protein ZOSMA_563G00070 [Zostera marina]